MKYVFFSMAIAMAMAFFSQNTAHAVGFETVFNYASTFSQDPAIEKRIVELIDAAEPNSEIYSSLYQFDSEKIVEAINRASAKNVKIQIVLDDTGRERSYKTQAQNLRWALGDNLTICTGGACVGTNNNHNKFWAFSAITDRFGSSKNVAVISSGNYNSKQYRVYNNALIVRDSQTVFEQLKRYTQDLAAQVKIPDYMNSHENGTKTELGGDMTVFLHPSLRSDPILDLLKATLCRSGQSVRLAFPTFQQDRAIHVLNELIRLTQTGCSVSFVTRPDEDENEQIEGLKASAVQTLSLSNVHSKYVLIDADVNLQGRGYRNVRLVQTGSSNMTGPSLTVNDEVTVRLINDQVYAQYLANWEKLKKKAKQINR